MLLLLAIDIVAGDGVELLASIDVGNVEYMLCFGVNTAARLARARGKREHAQKPC